ncbi:hypothetical protein ACFYKX_10335 [Cytobacillus sp. FJAT-54145]|uniref:Uncharacterized protein n=1 Tax=Cytobacillus spartinae TaxID=3299023 RepID=A0ABW6KA25_9BACI
MKNRLTKVVSLFLILMLLIPMSALGAGFGGVTSGSGSGSTPPTSSLGGSTNYTGNQGSFGAIGVINVGNEVNNNGGGAYAIDNNGMFDLYVSNPTLSGPSTPVYVPEVTVEWKYFVHYTGEKVNASQICSIGGASAPWSDPQYQLVTTLSTGPAFGTSHSFGSGGVYFVKAVPISNYGRWNWNGEAKQFWISVTNDTVGKSMKLPVSSCMQNAKPSLSGGGMVQDNFEHKDVKVNKQRGMFTNRQVKYRDFLKNYGKSGNFGTISDEQ